jgi:hypothetical protein
MDQEIAATRLELAREQLALSRQCLDFLEELRVEVLLI